MADVNRINPDRPHIYPSAIHIVAARLDAANEPDEPDVFHYGQPPINDSPIVRSTYHRDAHFRRLADYYRFTGHDFDDPDNCECVKCRPEDYTRYTLNGKAIAVEDHDV